MPFCLPSLLSALHHCDTIITHRPLEDTGSSWTCSKFARPSDADSCPGFNTYKLGLEGLAQSGSPYLTQPRITSNPGAVSAAYLTKSILYILGGADTCNCNTQGYDNPGACIRDDAGEDGARGCSPSVAGPQCCDMPANKTTNSFVDVTCGEMMQVGCLKNAVMGSAGPLLPAGA